MAEDSPLEIIERYKEETFARITSFLKSKKEPAPDYIYHYTDKNGLYGILQSGNIWLSDIYQMNDPSEMRYGLTPVNDIADKLITGPNYQTREFGLHLKFMIDNSIRSIVQFYIASFTQKENDLNQWRAYGDDGHGFALKFSGGALEKCFVDKRNALCATFLPKYSNKELVNIIAENEKELSPLIKQLQSGYEWHNSLKQLINIFLIEMLMHSIFYKHEAYTEEKEYRFLIAQADLTQNTTQNVKIHPVSGRVYTEFDWKTSAAGALQEVMIGPAADKDAEYWVEQCLKISGYARNSVKISRSEIPYRSSRR